MKHSRQKQLEKIGYEPFDKDNPYDKNIPIRTNVSHLWDHTLDMTMEINHKYDRFRKGYQRSW
ncbi:hypothetical protein [Bacillus cereus]|uniref:hypothetical protein n=1 Tax=Bacillus cereus TaxID=1396 RepID=UPI000BFB035E|nr:hypothetical protein [Bacillus cereus]PFD41419.1 hypothetical protein CN281_26930 [Bacillus cereus]